MKKLLFLISIFFILGVFSNISNVEAGSVSTGFTQVVLEELEPGKTYSTTEERGIPLDVANETEASLRIKIDILQPKGQELIEGYEPIPDISWITLEKNEFKLEPGGVGITDVKISIPDDKEYRGKKYQVYLFSYTTGRAVGVGLRSRLLFTIAPAKD